MICTSQAIVLNKKKFSDSSLICTIYSEEYGKVSIIAKGARSIKNPSGAILEPLNHIDLIYYYKPKRNIQLFKEASIIKKHYSISDSYKKSLYSLIILDVINYTSYVESPCNIIFRLIKSSLHYIDKSSEDEGWSIGRSYRDAPEIDNYVRINEYVPEGKFINIEYVDAFEYDLLAKRILK